MMIIFYLWNAIASVILGDTFPWTALELVLATHKPLSPASPGGWCVRQQRQQQQQQKVGVLSDFEIFKGRQASFDEISPGALPSSQPLQPILVARESVGGRGVEPVRGKIGLPAVEGDF